MKFRNDERTTVQHVENCTLEVTHTSGGDGEIEMETRGRVPMQWAKLGTIRAIDVPIGTIEYGVTVRSQVHRVVWDTLNEFPRAISILVDGRLQEGSERASRVWMIVDSQDGADRVARALRDLAYLCGAQEHSDPY